MTGSSSLKDRRTIVDTGTASIWAKPMARMQTLRKDRGAASPSRRARRVARATAAHRSHALAADGGGGGRQVSRHGVWDTGSAALPAVGSKSCFPQWRCAGRGRGCRYRHESGTTIAAAARQATSPHERRQALDPGGDKEPRRASMKKTLLKDTTPRGRQCRLPPHRMGWQPRSPSAGGGRTRAPPSQRSWAATPPLPLVAPLSSKRAASEPTPLPPYVTSAGCMAALPMPPLRSSLSRPPRRTETRLSRGPRSAQNTGCRPLCWSVTQAVA